MKKVVICFTVLMCFLVLGNVKTVSAAEIDIDDIENSTYVIGKCMFTREISENYSGILTTNVIMLAAKTITSDALEDMVIYYKNARGVWINALTNQSVEMADTVSIEYKNNEIYMEKATLENATLKLWEQDNPNSDYVPNLSEGLYHYNLKITNSIISGYEIYEKQGDSYDKIGEGLPDSLGIFKVSVSPGERKSFVARIYALKKDNSRIYGDYSNEVTIDNRTLLTPNLQNITVANNPNNYIPNLEEGSYHYDLGIDSSLYQSSSNVSISGYEIYEKEGNTYKEALVGKVDDTISVSIQPGEKKVYVARVYASKVNGDKVYSDYSNEITIDHEILLTPKLENVTIKTWKQEHLDQPYVAELVEGAYHYDLGIDSSFYQSGSNISVSGYEIYTEQGITYTKVGEGSIGPSETVKVTVAPGERKVFYARVYAITSEGERIYSTYSDNMVIDHSDETP